MSPRTLRRWRATNRAPEWARRALIAICTGIPVGALADWDGWQFRRVTFMEPPPPGGKRRRPGVRWALVDPDGYPWHPSDLAAYRQRMGQLQEVQQREAPGSQLTWTPPHAASRRAAGTAPWPGGIERPTRALIEDCLRAVVEDVMRAERLRGT